MKDRLSASYAEASRLYKEGEIFPSVLIAASLPILVGVESSRFGRDLYAHLRESDDYIDESLDQNSSKLAALSLLRDCVLNNHVNEGIGEYFNIDLFKGMVSHPLFERIQPYYLWAIKGYEREVRYKNSQKNEPDQIEIEDLRARAMLPYILMAFTLLFPNSQQPEINELKILTRWSRQLAILGDLRDIEEDKSLGITRFTSAEIPHDKTGSAVKTYIKGILKSTFSETMNFLRNMSSVSVPQRIGCASVVSLRNLLIAYKEFKKLKIEA
jgi:hypothetical protein